jgi:stress response protein YsnF
LSHEREGGSVAGARADNRGVVVVGKETRKARRRTVDPVDREVLARIVEQRTGAGRQRGVDADEQKAGFYFTLQR